jgi:DNA polymerase (family 10)
MENLAIARVFAEIADLLEIRNENPFKIRAYRNAAETIVHHPDRIADLPAEGRRDLPGIGKDLAAKIGELVDTGAVKYHQELLAEFPPTLLDLLNLQGVGPKTVALCSITISASARSTISSARRATAGCASSRAWARRKRRSCSRRSRNGPASPGGS